VCVFALGACATRGFWQKAQEKRREAMENPGPGDACWPCSNSPVCGWPKHTLPHNTHPFTDTEVANNRRNVLFVQLFSFDQTRGVAPTSPVSPPGFPTSRTSQTHSFVKLNHMACGMSLGGVGESGRTGPNGLREVPGGGFYYAPFANVLMKRIREP